MAAPQRLIAKVDENMKFTINLKLILAFAFLIVLLVGTAAYSIRSLSQLNDSMEAMVTGPVTRLELVQNINTAQLQSIRQQKNLIGASSQSEIQSWRRRATKLART